MARTETDKAKHAAGGPGKPNKEGHIDPEKSNVGGQKGVGKERGPGKGGSRGAANEDRRKAPG